LLAFVDHDFVIVLDGSEPASAGFDFSPGPVSTKPAASIVGGNALECDGGSPVGGNVGVEAAACYGNWEVATPKRKKPAPKKRQREQQLGRPLRNAVRTRAVLRGTRPDDDGPTEEEFERDFEVDPVRAAELDFELTAIYEPETPEHFAFKARWVGLSEDTSAELQRLPSESKRRVLALLAAIRFGFLNNLRSQAFSEIVTADGRNPGAIPRGKSGLDALIIAIEQNAEAVIEMCKYASLAELEVGDLKATIELIRGSLPLLRKVRASIRTPRTNPGPPSTHSLLLDATPFDSNPKPTRYKSRGLSSRVGKILEAGGMKLHAAAQLAKSMVNDVMWLRDQDQRRRSQFKNSVFTDHP